MATNDNTSARVTVRLSDRDRINGIDHLVEKGVFANDSELVRAGIDSVLDDHDHDHDHDGMEVSLE